MARDETYIRNPQHAFKSALRQGVLSHVTNKHRYYGRYMYMYSIGKVDYFKDIITREYIQANH